jgi:WD40 repeat protein
MISHCDAKFKAGSRYFSLTETRSEIYAVNFSEMKFSKIFYKSDDFITAIDVFPLNKKLICCANYSGRLVLYDYERKVQVIEHQLKLRKRRSSISDIDVIEIPHVSALAFSRNGHHLVCGLENGTIVCLDVDVLRELRSFSLLQSEVVNIKFSPDSFLMVAYVS